MYAYKYSYIINIFLIDFNIINMKYIYINIDAETYINI